MIDSPKAKQLAEQERASAVSTTRCVWLIAHRRSMSANKHTMDLIRMLNGLMWGLKAHINSENVGIQTKS